jgi:hypothetical protein
MQRFRVFETCESDSELLRHNGFFKNRQVKRFPLAPNFRGAAEIVGLRLIAAPRQHADEIALEGIASTKRDACPICCLY